MQDLTASLSDIVGQENVLTGERLVDDYTHDEALSVEPQRAAAVVRAATTDQVARVLRFANEHGVPVTARMPPAFVATFPPSVALFSPGKTG